MPELHFASSQKLTIVAYKDGKRARMGGKIGSFEAMFNPDTVRRSFENLFRHQQSLNSAGRQASFVYTRPEQIELNIIIDGTSLGAALSSKSVDIVPKIVDIDVRKKVEEFRQLAFSLNGDIHQPNFLKLSMGTALEEVPCRLAAFTLEYSNFDDNGNPKRAEIEARFIVEMDAAKQNALTSKASADLTHQRRVKNGDTLPLLAKDIYGSAAFYLQLARINDLDHFRQLQPGASLLFPPVQNNNDPSS